MFRSIYIFIGLCILLPSCQEDKNKEVSNVQEIDCSFDKSMTIKMSEITDSIELATTGRNWKKCWNTIGATK